MLRHFRFVRVGAMMAAAVLASLSTLSAGTAYADDSHTVVRIEGSGSTWSSNAIDQWRRDIKKSGITVDYAGVGSSAGRQQFADGVTDFGVTEVPYQFHAAFPGDVEDHVSRAYAYMPIVAGGTSFMYHLTVAGKQVTNLRLSPATITKIFTGSIKDWSDPAITADYGAQLPSKTITPLIRSDGSGTSAQFTRYMAKTQPDLWGAFCQRVGRTSGCGMTSNYPAFEGAKALNGSIGVASYISADYGDGSIGYVEYSYALNANYPVVKVLNAGGYYVEPTPGAVAVALTQAQIDNDASNPDTYLTQNLDSVYTDTDPRTYPLSSYSYMIIPTETSSGFDEDSGYTLGQFAYYFLCQGQQQMGDLGYSPLPANLVQAGFEQVSKIPGVDTRNLNIASCGNPTFNADGSNRLAELAPQPPECDRAGGVPCSQGTGGAAQTPTTNVPTTTSNGANTTAGAATTGSGQAATDPGTSANSPGQQGQGVPDATATANAAPVVVPPGSVTAGDGSIRDKNGKVIAKPGTVKAPAGSVVTASGDLKTKSGATISGAKAVADAQSARAAAAPRPAAAAAKQGDVVLDPVTNKPVTLGGASAGGGGVSLGSSGGTVSAGSEPGFLGAQPVAANTLLGPVKQGGTTTVLLVLTALALLGAVVLPPLMARSVTRAPQSQHSNGEPR